MNAIALIARRELGSYFRTWLGYIIIAAVLLLQGILFNAFALGTGMDRRSSDVLMQFFYTMSGCTMVAAIFISMRLLAAEREGGTVNLLYSSPVRDFEIVIGKFLSGLAFLAIVLFATSFMPAMVLVAGKISWGHVFAGYLGLLLLGSAVLAVGTLGSALTKSQILSVIISALMVVALLTCWWVGRVSDRPLSNIFENLALWQIHFQPFMQGMIHTRDVIFYLAITYVGLFGATRVLEARRWR
jgi:ABC-2 type transport system permease protein